ncbi:FAD binding domain-containing protein [Cyathus striatus]|nr:FAD binding domain-containing protein [Cyathus striatus]
MSDLIPVLIVGAGPAGLVAALFLAQNGIMLRIIDKEDTFHIGSRGFGVQPRTLELFQLLGILEDVQNSFTPIPTMRAYKFPGGTVLVRTWDLYEKSDVQWPDRPFGNGVCLSQHYLEEVLRSHLAKHGVQVELGLGLVGVEQTKDSVIASIAPHKGSHVSGDAVKVATKYMLGADGARGNSRKLLGLTFQGDTRDSDGMVWGDVEIDSLTNDFWHIWGKPGHFTIMARPLEPLNPESKKFGIGITGQNFDPTELATPEKTIGFIHNETGRTDLKFGKFTWLSYFKPNMRMVNKFQEGRAFVVGDSAHVHSPTGGQGMNCSVQDACNISWNPLLTTYNEERLPVIAQMLHATTQLYTHTVAKEKPADAPERNNALEMYGVNYRFSSIVLEKRDSQSLDLEDAVARAYAGYEGLGTLRAGDRAPEAPGLVESGSENSKSLFQLLKSNVHTVLTFHGGSTSEAVQFFDIFKKPPQNPTKNGLIDSHIGDGELTIVVVRPDGFIGAIVSSVDDVKSYFSKVEAY